MDCSDAKLRKYPFFIHFRVAGVVGYVSRCGGLEQTGHGRRRRWRFGGAADGTGVCAGDDAGGVGSCRETENRARAGLTADAKTGRGEESRGGRVRECCRAVGSARLWVPRGGADRVCVVFMPRGCEQGENAPHCRGADARASRREAGC